MTSSTVPGGGVMEAETTVAPGGPAAVATERAAPPAPAARRAGRADYLALGYLRAFVTVLVVAHHAVLAYNAFAPPPPESLAAEPRWWLAFPVVDPQKSVLWTLFNAFNETFFMAL